MELKEQLNDLAVKLEGKSKEQAENLIKEFEAKNSEYINNQVKEVKDTFEKEVEALKKHANELDVKLQSKAKKDSQSGDWLKNAIEENFDNIKTVEKGRSFRTKAVGNMTLSASLTGDQPRVYDFNVVRAPRQLLNVSDLVPTVNIQGGTYTYTRVAKGEGSISAQTEGSSKSQIDYDYSLIDVNTDFLAGFARFSRKMQNNLPFLRSDLPVELRADYFEAENAKFYTVLAADATASTEIITGNTKAGMLINDVAKLEDTNYMANGIVVRPSDWFDILKTAKQDLESIVTFEGGVLRVSGIPVYKATWLAAGKYFVGDWSKISKVVTEGVNLAFSEEEGSNFVSNMITARIEEQNAIAVKQPASLVFGDFAAV